jgi:hypothetical protein
MLTVIMFSLLSLTLVLAPDGDVVQDVPIDWGSTDDFSTNFMNDPAGGFANNPDLAWQTLSLDPSMMQDLDTISAAFDNDPMKAAEIINGDPDLLDIVYQDDEGVESYEARERFKESALNSEIDLNEYPEAKVGFMQSEYQITMDSADVGISGYEAVYQLNQDGEPVLGIDGEPIIVGEKITTTMSKNVKDENNVLIYDEDGNPVFEDVPAGTYTISDFSGARINARGKLILGDDGICIRCTIHESSDFSLQRDQDGNLILDASGEPQLNLIGGTMFVGNEFDTSISVEDGLLEGLGDVNLEGDFTLEHTTDGMVLDGENVKVSYHVDLDEGEEYHYGAEVIVPDGEFVINKGVCVLPPEGEGAFIFLGDASIGKVEPYDSSILEIDAISDDSKVYYVPLGSRDAPKYCQDEYTCIVDMPGYGGDKPDRMIMRNIQDVESIELTTSDYYSSVQVEGVNEGEVSFTSVNPNTGEVESVITVDETNQPSFSGDLADTNAGRFDVITDSGDDCEDTDCSSTIYHWSSNQNMKSAKGDYTSTGEYFTDDREAFVTCQVGNGCEQTFAENFGKVVLEGDQEPQTTVVVAGDNAETARNMESWCRSNGGCYIVSSRDVPLTTQSTNLIVTGHHWEHDTYIWRDPEVTENGYHNPIDVIHIEEPTEGTGILFDHLPTGQIENVAFSACNSVRHITPQESEYEDIEPEWNVAPIFYALENQYEDLQSVTGYHVKAPLVDHRVNSPEPRLRSDMARIVRNEETDNFQITFDDVNYDDVMMPEEKMVESGLENDGVLGSEDAISDE